MEAERKQEAEKRAMEESLGGEVKRMRVEMEKLKQDKEHLKESMKILKEVRLVMRNMFLALPLITCIRTPIKTQTW